MSPNRITDTPAVISPPRRLMIRLARVTVITYSMENGLSMAPVVATKKLSSNRSTPTWRYANRVKARSSVRYLMVTA